MIALPAAFVAGLLILFFGPAVLLLAVVYALYARVKDHLKKYLTEPHSSTYT